MNFTSCDKILATIRATDDPARKQGNNRAKINQLFNGAPLLSEEDARKLSLKINCNFGEAPVLGQHGRRQYQNAFLSRSTFFTVRLPDAPVEKQADWSAFITRKINKVLKRSLQYFELQRSKWAAVLLHGYAPTLYYDKYSTRPEFVALEDIRFPTDTKCDLSNLSWFAVRKAYTEGELARKVFSANSKGWSKPVVAKLLDAVHDKNWEPNAPKWADNPEKMAELIKQNGGFYSGDAVPTIPLFHFYFLDDSDKKNPEWRLRVVPDTATLSDVGNEFIFDDGKRCAAKKIEQLLQMQYGDLNNKPPFLIHSIRALGFLVMEPIFHSNLLDCRFLQHVHEHMNAWLRVQDVQGKARAQKVDLYNMGIVPDGVSIVPQTERHQIEPQLVAMAKRGMSELKQQASLAYTQDSESQRNTEETATQVMARVSQINAMMSGLLGTAQQYETFQCEEVCRRFCLRNSEDSDARDFQKACREEGIPSVWINSELWEIEVAMPLGNGNPTMEMAQADKLMERIAAFDTSGQQEIKHEWTIAVTGDPKKAERWAPIGQERGVTDAQEHAELAFSTLMFGVPVQRKQGLSLVDQISTIIGCMAGVIAQIEKTGNMATARDVAGLLNCEQYVDQMIQQLAMDEQQAPIAKQFAQSLGKLMNTVKGFQQRLAEQAGANGENGEAAVAQAKIQAMVTQAMTKAKIAEENAQLKNHHKDQAFVADQHRKDLQTEHGERRKDAEAFAEIQREHIKVVQKPTPAGT
jgi:hypothetical protein